METRLELSYLREDAQSKQELGNKGTRSEVGPTCKGESLVSSPLETTTTLLSVSNLIR